MIRSGERSSSCVAPTASGSGSAPERDQRLEHEQDGALAGGRLAHPESGEMGHREGDRAGSAAQGQDPRLDLGRGEAVHDEAAGERVEAAHVVLVEVSEERLAEQLVTPAGQDAPGGEVDLEDQEVLVAADVADRDPLEAGARAAPSRWTPPPVARAVSPMTSKPCTPPGLAFAAESRFPPCSATHFGTTESTTESGTATSRATLRDGSHARTGLLPFSAWRLTSPPRSIRTPVARPNTSAPVPGSGPLPTCSRGLGWAGLQHLRLGVHRGRGERRRPGHREERQPDLGWRHDRGRCLRGSAGDLHQRPATADRVPCATRGLRSTLVRHGTTLGASVTIVCGVTIGPYAMIGAGAVVTRDVPAHVVAAGVPARPVGWACVCGRPVDPPHACECGRRFRLTADGGLAELDPADRS